MPTFLSAFFSVLFCSAAPVLVFGLAMWLCRSLFVSLCGEYSGRRLILFASILSTPLREAAHAIACLAFFHRIEELRLFNPRDPDGELGFVEHSYNPRNPIALLGNLIYAVSPVIVGLAATALICLTCFRGVLDPLIARIEVLTDSGAGFLSYLDAARSLIPDIFSGGNADVVSRIIGIALLLLICLGAYCTPSELGDSISGMVIYTALCAVCAAVVAFLDVRITRIVQGALRAFATTVLSLSLVMLLAAAALLLLGGIFFLVRGILGLDMRESENESETEE